MADIQPYGCSILARHSPRRARRTQRAKLVNIGAVFSLVRSRPPDDRDIRDLRARVSEQGALLDARLARVTQLESELDAFKVRYRREVGRLHEELDELEYAIAELELAELARQLGPGADGPAGAARRRTRRACASLHVGRCPQPVSRRRESHPPGSRRQRARSPASPHLDDRGQSRVRARRRTTSASDSSSVGKRRRGGACQRRRCRASPAPAAAGPESTISSRPATATSRRSRTRRCGN